MRTISTVVVAPVLVCFVLATAVDAQAPSDDSARSRAVHQAGAPATPVDDVLFRRAEQMVRDGRGDAGRALVDSALNKARAGSPQHGQALYWRASLAADAAEAERGYRRVILEYPATLWAGNALVNLAQLEMARGDQEQALVHLHRFEREYGSHESRARASLWLARLYFDRKNEKRGCALLTTARMAASPDDVELGNQFDYLAQRCIGVDTASVPPRHPPSVAASQGDVPGPAAAVPAPTAPVSTSALPEGRTRDSQPPSPTPDSALDARMSVAKYTVQVAAYDTRAAAETLIAKLNARGYTARLATTARPFRVRIGRYDSRADAVAAQQRLKARGIAGFVTEMERP